MPRAPEGQKRPGDIDLRPNDVVEEDDRFAAFTEWSSGVDDIAYRDL